MFRLVKGPYFPKSIRLIMSGFIRKNKILFDRRMVFFSLLLVISFVFVSSATNGQQKDGITSAASWLDNNSNSIQAHGGGIIKVENAYYWFGEYRGKDVQPGYRYVGCYSSTDLMHWTFRKKNTVFQTAGD